MSATFPSDRRLGGLFKHSAIYSLAPVLRQFITVGMHRLYTGWLGAAGIGVKELVDLWAIGLQQMLGQNVLGSMVRFYFDQKDEADRARVVTSCTISIAAVAWILCAVAFTFSGDLAPLLLGGGSEQIPPADLVDILQLVLLLVPFQLSTIAGFYYLQIRKRSGLFTTIQTAKLLVEVGLNFWLMGARGLGVQGFLMSMLVGETLTSLGLTGWMLVTLRPRFDWRVLKPILVYAAPLIPVGVCQLALHQVDRRLLEFFGSDGAGQTMVGIYGHGYKISYLVTAMLLGPFIQIFQPWIFEVKEEGERGRLLARVSSYAVLAVGGLSLGVILFGRQAAILLANPDKAADLFDAYRVIPWVAGGYVLWALYHVSQMPLFIAKRTGRLFGINLAAVALNVGLNAILIPRYGITGAAVTTCVTFAALAVMGMVASRSEVHTPFELGRIGGVLLVVFLGGVLALWIDSLDAASRMNVAVALGIKAAGCGALLLALWYGVLRRDERQDLATWYRARRGR